MSCFCRQATLVPPAAEAAIRLRLGLPPGAALSSTALASAALRLDAAVTVGEAGAPLAAPLAAPPLVLAVSAWLAARWLPGPAFTPDPAWLDIDWPEPPMPPTAMSVLLSLVTARQSCIAVLGIDPVQPAGLRALARVIATLNLRGSLLLALEADARPWESLLAVQAQADLVASAAAAGVFAPVAAAGAPAGVLAGATLAAGGGLALGGEAAAFAPWRPMLAKVKALAPLVAIGQVLGLDWRDPGATATLAALVRPLRQMVLPALADQPLVLRLLGRFDALARLTLAFGADPSPHAFARVRAAVELRATRALALLPPGVRLEAGQLAGMPPLPPNPALILNAETVTLAAQLRPAVLDGLRWQVPDFAALPLLATALPVVSLLAALRRLDIDPLRPTPCEGCDALAALS